jgi:agmatine deiminase
VSDTLRMPAETDVHERTLMAWPTGVRRDALWRDQLEAARDEYAEIARTIARFEPVLMVVAPDEAHTARPRLGDEVDIDIVKLPIDDAWLRDSGPIFVRTANGDRRGLHFLFNGWGGKYSPILADELIGSRLSTHLDIRWHAVPLVLEGGAIAVDGNGLLVTTERCLLNANRNGGIPRSLIDAALERWLGASRVVWLADGIAEDDETDGHVDNVVSFFAPGHALLQGCSDPANPNHAIAADNRTRLNAAGIDVVEIPHLPYSEVDGELRPVPYCNLYPCNGAVIVPVSGDPYDASALATIETCFSGRTVVPVPARVLAYGGGGVHCITQPVPAL